MELVPVCGLQWVRRMTDRDGHSNRAGSLQSLRLLADEAQLESKRTNEGDPSQSETSEALRARRANDSGLPVPSGLR
jgi:hypothetical protein